MSMRGLTIVVTRPSGVHAALELAAANAALGGRARLFAQGEAVAALALPMRTPHDDDYRAAGVPTLGELYEEAMELDVQVIACQSGLTLMGLTPNMLDVRMTFGGSVGVLQTLGGDRLVAM